MKIFNLIKGHKMGFLSFLLVAAAVVLGADCSFAMAEALGVDEVGEITPAKENVNPVEDERYSEDAKGLHTVVEGAATATKADETGFSEEEIDRQIANAFLFNFPLQYYIVNMARQQTVKTYHPKHFRSGSAKLDCVLSSSVSVEGGEGAIEITISTSNISNAKAIKPYSTIFFRGVAGYDVKTDSPKGDLMGYVTANDGTNVSVTLINPKQMESFSIPAKTAVFIGATAGSETQLVVPPDNYQPIAYEVYLQKKLSNIIWSKEWEQQTKKADFAQKDLRNNALWIFKYKNAVAHWLGSQAVVNVDMGNDLGEERVYFEEGLLNQVNMMYSYDPDGITPEDFNAIARMQFTRFSKNNHAVAFCGAGFLEKMQNMDVQKVQSVATKSVEVTGGLIVKRWDSVFGNIDFVYDPIFTEIGYGDFAFICDIKELTRYVKREQKESTLDMEKTSDAREAKREMVSIIDCIATRGYNNILVGPSDQMYLTTNLAALEDVVTQVDALSKVTSPKDGQIVYLSTDKNFYQYNAETSEWEDYKGAL